MPTKLEKRINFSLKVGIRNQYRSKQYMLRHPYLYGILPDKATSTELISDRIEVATFKGKMMHDLFNFEYKDLNGKMQKAGWDIISMPDDNPDQIQRAGLPMFEVETKDYFKVHLVQVKTNYTLNSESIRYLEALCNFRVAPYVKKELHIWYTGEKIPTVIELNNFEDVCIKLKSVSKQMI